MKNALITGTSKGMGLELANELLANGYCVIGVSRSHCPIEHENYHHLSADITSDSYKHSLNEFVNEKAIEHFEILINNAGVGAIGSDIESIDADELRYQFELHCVSVFITIQALYPLLNKSKLVNITSRLGSTKFNARGDFIGRGFSYAYRVAKSAQNMLSLCLAGDDKLRDNLVISIIPGLLRTDSGASDAEASAIDGAKGVLKIINSTDKSGIYHAFGDEAEY